MELIRVYNNIIPFQGYIAMTFFPWVFIRKKNTIRFTPKVERHETTHGYQQLETLWVIFLVLYGLEYLIKLLFTFSHKKAYRSISFEQEAYEHELEISYNDVRKHYAWMKYVFKLKK